MKDALIQFVSSKRFWLTVAGVVSALVSWKLGAADGAATATRIEHLLELLTGSYALDSVAQAIPFAPKGMKLVSIMPPPPPQMPDVNP